MLLARSQDLVRVLVRSRIHARFLAAPLAVSYQGFFAQRSLSSAPRQPPQKPPQKHQPPLRKHIPMSYTPGVLPVNVVDADGSVVGTASITLLAQECELFSVLAAVVATQPGFAHTTVRIAGGWVRDKLLGRLSNDLDVALDTHTGTAFAEAVGVYMRSQGQSVGRVSTIAANPEQSKHLETATARVVGLEVDFVNLRAEEYASHSRIPTMTFGTALQDALRRDITINAMFFNVNKRVIEDFTGAGYVDLQAGLIRTPLPPTVTFADDPLRVMRAVRFGGRYGFQLHADIRAAIADPGIQAALMGKVSRERVGSELDGMLNGDAPLASLRLLLSVGLLPVLFEVPFVMATPPLLTGPAVCDDVDVASGGASAGGSVAPASAAASAASGGAGADARAGASASSSSVPLSGDASAPVRVSTQPSLPWSTACDILDSTSAVLRVMCPLLPAAAELLSDKARMRRLYLSALLVGFAGAQYEVKPRKLEPVVRYIVKDGIKRSSADADACTLLQKGVAGLAHLTRKLGLPPSFLADVHVRLLTGRLVRELKDAWLPAVALASSSALVFGRADEAVWLQGLATAVAADPIVANAWLLKPVINGKDLSTRLGVAGSAISALVDLQIDYQLTGPPMDAAECEARLVAHLRAKAAPTAAAASATTAATE